MLAIVASSCDQIRMAYEDLRRHHVLVNIFRALFDRDPMQAAEAREVLCEGFDREIVLDAWGLVMRECAAKGELRPWSLLQRGRHRIPHPLGQVHPVAVRRRLRSGPQVARDANGERLPTLVGW